jgi:hypothetical protein
MPGPTPNPTPVPQWFQLWYVNPVTGKQDPVSDTSANIQFLNPADNSAFTTLQSEIGSARNNYEVSIPNNQAVLIEWHQSSGLTLAVQASTGTYGYPSVNQPDLVTLN